MPGFLNGNGPIPGVSLAFPDVCKTPAGPAPVPIPYPNTTMMNSAIPTQFTVFAGCMPSANLMTVVPTSMGNQPGVLLGLVSNLVMGPQKHLLGSVTLFVASLPATRMLDPTGQNGMMPNAPGMTLSPSNLTVMSLS